MSDQNENESGALGRREVLGALGKGAAAVGAALAAPKALADASQPGGDFDYIVVGSGAGGGPVACNLAKAGFRVLLIEAGANAPTKNYDVPVFHGLSTEDPAMAWNFFVDHYANSAQQMRDSKLVHGKGVLYPRAGTLGGCTAHNAMITLYPDNSDFDNIVKLTGDNSWNSQAMRKYYQRIENQNFEKDSTAHDSFHREGTNGWLSTEQTNPTLLLKSAKLAAMVVAAAQVEGIANEIVDKVIRQHGNFKLDPNEWGYVQKKADGLFNIPKATQNGHRNGTRELILRTMQKYPNLVLKTDTLVTQVLFAPGTTKAIGVEFLTGKHLYRADPNASANAAHAAVKGQAMAKREIILSGGAFNSPQVLMLSGIGPKGDLQRLGITPRLDLPGVGKNLQDRYEVGVVLRFKEPINILKDCTFGQGNDPCLDTWNKGPSTALYGSNGVVIANIKRSNKSKADPDLVLFGLPGNFTGYAPGWARKAIQPDTFTWAILKGHTKNTAGTVTLKSKDPLETPKINFKYFDESNDAGKEDLEAVLAGLKIARKINSKLEVKLLSKHEETPGPNYQTDDQLRSFIKNEAWGHHASCSNKMGPRSDPMAVVDSKFKVHGTTGLRVVDASVFPRIPGLFIVVPIYMAAEKASETIIADARAATTTAR
jgi:choline dehydrogenase